MIRKAFKLQVYADKYQEYIDRHNNVYPALVEEIKKSGAANYSIFLDEETGFLFGYVEIESEEKWQQISKTDACREWWGYMQDIMETNADTSPKSTELKNVFYLA